MKKKIIAISILAVFMMVAISYATAVNTTNTEKKESPLYRIRASLSGGRNLLNILENIKTRFLGGRMFFIPRLRLQINNPREPMFKVNTNFEECTMYESMCNGPMGCASYYEPQLCTVVPGPDKYCATNMVFCKND